mmetsp:Transcript_7503/g.11220  ORF Transcript_7503/g.11220 Transcript_7503/m.11220 type:complete len:461 (+) Transcript_7503:212-1594(+)
MMRTEVIHEHRLIQQAESYGFKIENTPEKGRVCLSKRRFEIGSVIFTEKAYVCASDDENCCMLCMEPHNKSNPPHHCKEMRQELGLTMDHQLNYLEVACKLIKDIPGFHTLDRARAFIKIILQISRKSEEFPIDCLSQANLPRCVEAVEKTKKICPLLIPSNVDSILAAKVLAALNTNSHELEELGGSGLFLLACTMEHNCSPNCNFTTHGDTIWLTAIKSISEGEPLSIDYGNNFYRPALERRKDLEETYEFECNCMACTVLPDLPRAFKCPSPVCLGGRVSPVGLGNDVSKFSCLKCKQICSENNVEVMLSEEKLLMDHLDVEEGIFIHPTEVEQCLNKFESIHSFHHAVFWALEGAAQVYATDPQCSEEAEKYLEYVIGAVEEILPIIHHEKVIYFDMMAQVKVLKGDIEGAKFWYDKAYQASKSVSGADTVPTLVLSELSHKPPNSVEELVKRYNK